MAGHAWVDGFPGAVTVCDQDGIILEMNEGSRESFAREGGAELIGSQVLDCHPEPSRSKLRAIMDERRSNVYTVEKGGAHKLVVQAPWYREGPEREFGGYVEIVLPVSGEMPHFVRST
jgi:hypothetical protein